MSRITSYDSLSNTDDLQLRSLLLRAVVPAAVHAVVDEDDVENHHKDTQHQLCHSDPIEEDLHPPLPGPLLLPHQGHGEDGVVIALKAILAIMNLVVHCL